MDFAGEQIGGGEIEEPHVAEVGRSVVPAELGAEPDGQPVDQLVSITGPGAALLLLLDDLPADEPVGPYHGRVDRPGGLGIPSGPPTDPPALLSRPDPQCYVDLSVIGRQTP
jgi:hypothetical protein